ncbi:unnamed protein product [Acanthoscelides obtectus]|uniref:Uncharacterized protein n=1 Tax=Acanthoscelides obtectus TaxID=200917 RepID=A0A9P0M2T2_ACAOB|nr:unnamed protein product [Acanthoscelides obtectus]CAK1685291.1 hypothetical protein AOBTE_LOCUS35309 [Acanthoscelides obtectus]
MHTFWLRLPEPPGGTSSFDSQRPSTHSARRLIRRPNSLLLRSPLLLLCS